MVFTLPRPIGSISLSPQPVVNTQLYLTSDAVRVLALSRGPARRATHATATADHLLFTARAPAPLCATAKTPRLRPAAGRAEIRAPTTASAEGRGARKMPGSRYHGDDKKRRGVAFFLHLPPPHHPPPSSTGSIAVPPSS